MIYLVIVDRITPEGKKDLKRVWEWQRQLDDWLISHGAKFKSVKHFLTLIGEPFYETWLEYRTTLLWTKTRRRRRNSRQTRGFRNLSLKWMSSLNE